MMVHRLTGWKNKAYNCSRITMLTATKKGRMYMAYEFLEPYEFAHKAITVKNRIVIPPMTEQMAFEDGSVTSDELAYYAKHSGGVGMFITAVANVNPLGKGFEGELSIADDRFIPGLRRLAQAIKSNGTKAIIQIFSAGRMSNSAVLRGQQPVSASAVAAERPDAEVPRALSEAEIEQTIQDFGQAVRRAIEAGFDGVELHGANTYLLQQFFSPHSNRRTDAWGGTLEKRMTFPLAVIDEAQRIIEQYPKKPFILGYRISPEELEQPGITIEDTLAFIDVLKTKPLDYLHVSTGDVWQTSMRDSNETRATTKRIQQQVDGVFPLIVVGGIATPAEAEKVKTSGFDFVALGHESIREPQWVEKVQQNDEKSIRYAISYAELAELGIQPPFLQMLYAVSGGPAGVPMTTPQNK